MKRLVRGSREPICFTHFGAAFHAFFACCYNELALIVTAVKRARSDHVMTYLRARQLDERCSDDERTIFK
jgi:hypothetical protein